MSLLPRFSSLQSAGYSSTIQKSKCLEKKKRINVRIAQNGMLMLGAVVSGGVINNHNHYYFFEMAAIMA